LEIITGGSDFNIKAESLRLGNFSREEIASLYSIHTKETGQVFEEGILDLVLPKFSFCKYTSKNTELFSACLRK
jgi:hypothetical protein